MQLKDPILITGAARSGTSLVANIIAQAGAKGGDMNKKADRYNPTGYYENHAMINTVDKALLKQEGYDTMGQTPLPPFNLKAFDIRDKVFQIARQQGIGSGKD